MTAYASVLDLVDPVRAAWRAVGRGLRRRRNEVQAFLYAFDLLNLTAPTYAANRDPQGSIG